LASDEAQKYLASVGAVGQVNAALTQTQREQSRVDDTMRSIGQTIDSSITQNLENAFSGQTITKWGDIAKQILAQIQAQLISLTIIKPAIGSPLGFGRWGQLPTEE